MTTKLYLKVVEHEEGDTVLENVRGGTIMDKFGDEESLACGACKNVLAREVSTRRAYEMFMAPKRLLFLCECGAHNLVPSQTSGH